MKSDQELSHQPRQPRYEADLLRQTIDETLPNNYKIDLRRLCVETKMRRKPDNAFQYDYNVRFWSPKAAFRIETDVVNVFKNFGAELRGLLTNIHIFLHAR